MCFNTLQLSSTLRMTVYSTVYCHGLNKVWLCDYINDMVSRVVINSAKIRMLWCQCDGYFIKASGVNISV